MASPRHTLHPLRLAVQSMRFSSRTTTHSTHRSFHSARPNAAIYSNADKVTLNKVLDNSQGRVVLVDFYADWCQPCRMFSPILEKFAAEPNTSANGLPVDLVKIDTESNEGQELAQQHKVHALPTVLVYKNGKPVTDFKGALPEAHFKKFLDTL